MESGESVVPAPAVRRTDLVPRPWVWVIWLVCGLGILAIRTFPIDLAEINVVTVLLLGVAGALFLKWWCFRSPFPASIRWLLPVVLLVGATVFAARYRLVGTSGSLVPQFARRGVLLHDENLASLSEGATQRTVDVTTTSGDDFPQFLGPDRNSRLTGTKLDRDWKANLPEQLWSREIGAGWSGFSAVNGYAFTMEQRGPLEMVTCYAIDTGEPCWSHSIETRHATVLGFIGPRSTPTIHDGRVYAMGANGILRCLQGDDGSVLWIKDLFDSYGMTESLASKAVAWGRAYSPLIVDDRVIIPAGGPRGGKCITLVALDAVSGDTVWEAGDYQVSYASPSLLTIAGVQQIVSVNEDYVSGHDRNTGELLWDHPWEGRSNTNANVSQPHAVGESQLWLSKGYGKGSELLTLTPIDDGLWDVEVEWSERVMKTKFSNIAIRNGFAYGLDDGILCCVEIRTGERQWKKGRYRYGQILLVDDLLLVMSEDGDVALVEASPEAHRELGRFHALDGQSWNTLCLYGDRLLVRNSEQAACYRLKLADED